MSFPESGPEQPMLERNLEETRLGILNGAYPAVFALAWINRIALVKSEANSMCQISRGGCDSLDDVMA